MKKKSFQLQHDQSDCGVACLANIIRHHGGDASLETLRKLSGTSQQGTTLLGLQQAAQQVGFDAEGLEAEGIHNLRELTEPVILHVTVEERLQHYVVYYPHQGMANKVIGDPARGILTMRETELDVLWKSKTLLWLKPNGQFQKRELVSYRKRKWILDLLREDFPVLSISLALGIMIAVLGIATAIFSQRLMDDILPKENIQKLLLSTVLVTFLMVARSGFNYLRGIFMVHQGKAFNNRVIRDFYASLLKLPKSFFDTRKTGELIARMSDTRRIQSVISILSGSAVIDLLLVLVSTGFVMFYSWWIGVVLVTCMGAYLFILWKFNGPISLAQKQVMAGYAFTESNFIDSMQGITEIKLMGKGRLFEKMNQAIYQQFLERMSSLGMLNSRFGLVSEITGGLFTMLVFSLSSYLVIRKELSIGELVALLGMAGNMIPSLTRLVVANIQWQEASVVFDRMFEFTSMSKEEVQEGKVMDYDSPLYLQLDRVSFRFPGRRQILSDVSMELRTGEMVGLTGESGGGKSTLLQLIQKFYAPESGTLLVNGTDLQEYATESWRSMLGCVSQEIKIFNNSLLFNITLSDEAEVNERAVAFCEQTGLGAYFRLLPQSYLTVVGEEGVNLSGGQKQLVAFARALFRNPKLLLLDEATSAMDSHMERFVLDLLQKNKHRMAILMVTHRSSTSLQCDRVVVLDKGVGVQMC
jgi:ABC-type bacteriocin/lantibiotic exporter with double-glycine peptidase domain